MYTYAQHVLQDGDFATSDLISVVGSKLLQVRKCLEDAVILRSRGLSLSLSINELSIHGLFSTSYAPIRPLLIIFLPSFLFLLLLLLFFFFAANRAQLQHFQREEKPHGAQRHDRSVVSGPSVRGQRRRRGVCGLVRQRRLCARASRASEPMGCLQV